MTHQPPITTDSRRRNAYMVNTTNEPQDKAIHRGEPNHGSVAKNDTTLDILQDLIAELRNKHCAEPESR